jgi:hypothetical protein
MADDPTRTPENSLGEALRSMSVNDRKAVTAEDIDSYLEKGLSVNDKDQFGNPALVWVASFCPLSVLAYFIDKGADVKSACDNRGTALMWLADIEERSVDDKRKVARFLLECGVDPTLRDDQGRDAVARAMQYRGPEHAKALQEEITLFQETVMQALVYERQQHLRSTAPRLLIRRRMI